MFSGVPNPERHRWEKAGAAKNKKFPQGSSEVYIPPGNLIDLSKPPPGATIREENTEEIGKSTCSTATGPTYEISQRQRPRRESTSVGTGRLGSPQDTRSVVSSRYGDDRFSASGTGVTTPLPYRPGPSLNFQRVTSDLLVPPQPSRATQYWPPQNSNAFSRGTHSGSQYSAPAGGQPTWPSQASAGSDFQAAYHPNYDDQQSPLPFGSSHDPSSPRFRQDLPGSFHHVAGKIPPSDPRRAPQVPASTSNSHRYTSGGPDAQTFRGSRPAPYGRAPEYSFHYEGKTPCGHRDRGTSTVPSNASRRAGTEPESSHRGPDIRHTETPPSRQGFSSHARSTFDTKGTARSGKGSSRSAQGTYTQSTSGEHPQTRQVPKVRLTLALKDKSYREGAPTSGDNTGPTYSDEQRKSSSSRPRRPPTIEDARYWGDMSDDHLYNGYLDEMKRVECALKSRDPKTVPTDEAAYLEAEEDFGARAEFAVSLARFCYGMEGSILDSLNGRTWKEPRIPTFMASIAKGRLVADFDADPQAREELAVRDARLLWDKEKEVSTWEQHRILEDNWPEIREILYDTVCTDDRTLEEKLQRWTTKDDMNDIEQTFRQHFDVIASDRSHFWPGG